MADSRPRTYRGLVRAIDKCARDAELKADRLFYALDLYDEGACRAALDKRVRAIIGSSGKSAAAAALNYYRHERKRVEKGYYFGFIPDFDDDEKISDGIDKVCRYLSTTNGTFDEVAALHELKSLVDRRVRNRGWWTLARNASADELRPRLRRKVEPGACEWCVEHGTDAYVSSWDVNAAMHEHCKCGIDIDFDGSKQERESKRRIMEPGEKEEVISAINTEFNRRFAGKVHCFFPYANHLYAFKVLDYSEYEFAWKKPLK